MLVELVTTIRKTAELVQEVSTTSQEQSAGVTQVSRAMGVVDQVTQRNASAAEELSSTAEEVASQADALQQVVSFFRLGNGHPAPSRARPAPRPAAPSPAAADASPALAPAAGLHPALRNGAPRPDPEFRRF
jgi:methyl-accepting chemotaxis protein